MLFCGSQVKERQRDMSKKERKVFIAEAVIAIVLLAAILLPQIIGTVDVAQSRGEWRTVKDLDGKIIGIVPGSVWTEKAREMWPNAVFREVPGDADLPKMTEGGTIDAFLASPDEVADILRAHPQLTVLLRNISDVADISAAAEQPFVVIRQADYAYHSTQKTLKDLDVPGLRFAVLTGSEATFFVPQLYPECELVYFNSFTDLFLALETGKADAAATYYSQQAILCDIYDDLAFISIPVVSVTYGFGTRKNADGDRLKQEINSYLREISASGDLAKSMQKWESMDADADASLHYTFSGKGVVQGGVRVRVHRFPFLHALRQIAAGADLPKITVDFLLEPVSVRVFPGAETIGDGNHGDADEGQIVINVAEYGLL